MIWFLASLPTPLLVLLVVGMGVLLIGLVLSLIIALDRPFTGDAAVKVEAFRAVLDEMERRAPG